MDAALAENGAWLVCKDFTLGDINMIPYVARLHYLNLLDVFIAERPRVKDWWKWASSRASTIDSFEKKLERSGIDEMQVYGSKIRDAVAGKRREYGEKFA